MEGARNSAGERERERAVQLDSGPSPDSPGSGPEHSAPLAIASVAKNKRRRNFGQSPTPQACVQAPETVHPNTVF